MTPVMTASLFAAYHAGSKAAFDQLVTANQGLAYSVANRFVAIAARHGYDREDVRGAALGGLVKAVIHFDPSNGAAFSTFAVDQIRAAVQGDLKLRRTESVTRRVQNPLTGEYEEKTVKQVRPVDSMSSPRGGEDSDDTLQDTIAGGVDAETESLARRINAQRDEAIAALGTFAATLTDPREVAIWAHKVLDDNRAIAPIAPTDLGCNSAARVSQIRKALLIRFREYLRTV